MDKQTVFNRVASHLLTQGQKSLIAGGSGACAYRGNGGRSCAVGCLIRDEDYCPGFEGRVMNVLAEHYDDIVNCRGMASSAERRQLIDALKKGAGVESGTDCQFLHELQAIHDLDEPESWQSKLQAFAEKEHLSSEVLVGR